MQDFPDPAAWRAWLEAHHADESELLVRFWKVGSGHPSITWAQSVREALCFGWVDGVRRRVDDESYTIRFTPRKPRSTWSAVNIALMAELEEHGLVHDAGRRAFALRTTQNSRIYAYEQTGPADDSVALTALEAVPQAWAFWQTQPPSYRKVALHWVASAKQETTRATRLAQLVEDSTQGLRIKSQRR